MWPYLAKVGKDRILVVDDDRDILELLEYNLEQEGFKVQLVENSADAVAQCIAFVPDLIILDIQMPEVNGIEVCRQIRSINKFKDTFIFFLTAKSESYYQEAALDTGGDDFIEKIIGIRSLTHKIKVVLRRKLIIRKRIPEVHIGSLHVLRRSGSARIGKREIRLSKLEFELLFFFAQNPERIITSDSLVSNFWGSEAFSPTSSIEFYLDMLMQKLEGLLLHKIEEGKYTLSKD